MHVFRPRQSRAARAAVPKGSVRPRQGNPVTPRRDGRTQDSFKGAEMLDPIEWIIFGAACAAVAITLAVGFGYFLGD